MVGTDGLYDVLVAGGRRADRVTHVRQLPARPGTQADWPAWADPQLVEGYRRLGVERPWLHQVQAADAVWSRRHTVLATSTGSGKSMAFWLPALTAVRTGLVDGRLDASERAGVLYLSPTKALAADQLSGLHRLLTASRTRDVHVATCDGDTGRDERRWVREHARVVLTNPDFLHFSMLPGHQRWARLLTGLRYVVVDECHAFRGVFGAHVALVLRRLRRVAASYGCDPTFVLASATTCDPAVSAARLIGVEPAQVEAITQDTAPAGRRTVVLWQPPELPGHTVLETGQGGAPSEDEQTVGTPVERPRRTATAEVADLLADLVVAGARTLAFTRSRRGAESVATATRGHLAAVDPALASCVQAYRGGYLPEERRELEQAVRSGRIRALATTNALELGVDIAGLDAVLIAGFPGTRVSWWQQAGRAGRAGADGLVTLVAREDPLDTYLVHHPQALLDEPVEATVFDPGNPAVLAPHLAAAAAELPLRPADLPLFGEHAQAVVDELTDRGVLRRRAAGWFWTHPEPASTLTDLRGTGGAPVRVVEGATGQVLGTVDQASADATVHTGAVYVHQGATFVVDALNLDEHLALVTRRSVDYGTWARWLTTTDVVEVEVEQAWGPLTWAYGTVDVTSQVLAFQRKRLPDLQVLGTDQLDLPARTLRTCAVWWTAPAELLLAAGVTVETAPGALHAAEHASIGLLPLLATCDRWDLGGLSTVLHPDTGHATVFVHDAFPGGAGFARRAFDLGPVWLAATRDAIRGCRCATGCPACVQSPKCGNGNEPLDKAAAVRLLDAVLVHAPR
ncbi:MAG: DEAD/DEAH box helicase [Cellulomonas sp.]|nr:DEAD/DEAH box helicase [Cellulomonas sp.]